MEQPSAALTLEQLIAAKDVLALAVAFEAARNKSQPSAGLTNLQTYFMAALVASDERVQTAINAPAASGPTAR